MKSNMDHKQYEIILKCIQFGVPALAEDTISAFNHMIERANKLTELEMLEAEKLRNAEIAKAKVKQEAKSEPTKVVKK